MEGVDVKHAARRSNKVTPLARGMGMEPKEWTVRVDLAAAYRVAAHLGWSELIYAHITARVPGPEHHFLINPYGLRWDEVTASNLVKIDVEGHEEACLRGAAELLRQDRPALLVEVAGDPNVEGTSASRVFTSLAAMGYEAYEVRNGVPTLVRLPEINFIDDKEGKPVGILQHIGRRPIAAFGNSDGDFQMLEWTTAGGGSRFGLLVHHDDAEREYAYDRKTTFGHLARGLDEGPKRGWTIVSMKNDWKQIYPR